MSKSEGNRNPRRAAALQYGPGDSAPVVVASGMGYLAERIVEAAADSGVPIYEDNSLATVLTQLQLGREIPPDLYQAIVEIYVYFLHFDPETGGVRQEEKPKQPVQTGEDTTQEVPADGTGEGGKMSEQ